MSVLPENQQKREKIFRFFAVLLAAALAGCAAKPVPMEERLALVWHEAGITPAAPVGDLHFLRRISLDFTGLPPTPERICAMQKDTAPDKRARLADELLDSRSFAVYQAHLWGDELRIKSEFPINLWPNAVQVYSRYVFESVRDNKPYDVFARELLTSSGSNFKNPASNFFRAVADRSPRGLAQAASLTFLGRNLSSFTPEEQKKFTAFFTRIGYKSSREWKEEFVFFRFPEPGAPDIVAAVPGRKQVTVPAGTDPRTVLAGEIIASDLFAEAMVHRVWRRLFGRDMTDSRLKPLLHETAIRFRKSGFNVRELYRTIALSSAYSLAPGTPEAEKVFAAYPIHRLNAEQISDRISFVLQKPFETYSSVIPEPFTYLPAGTPASAVEDGSISSPFLDLMGKPPRDSGAPDERHNRLTGEQKLFLLNSGKLYKQMQYASARRIRPAKTFDAQVNRLYLAALSRPAEQDELRLLRKLRNLRKFSPKQFWTDVLWSLVNSKEFIYQF